LLSVPFTTPARAAHFTNRKDELAKLLADLQPGRVVTLCGPGGIGKTALAAEAVWSLALAMRRRGFFSDGIIFHSFYNQPQAILALEAIARAFAKNRNPRPETRPNVRWPENRHYCCWTARKTPTTCGRCWMYATAAG